MDMMPEPVDQTHSTRNYFAHGGNELVVGGKLTLLPDSEVEGLEYSGQSGQGNQQSAEKTQEQEADR